MAALMNRMSVPAPLGAQRAAESNVTREVLGWLLGAEYYRSTAVEVGLPDMPVAKMSEIPLGDPRPAAMFRRVDFDEDDRDDIRVVSVVVVADDKPDDFSW